MAEDFQLNEEYVYRLAPDGKAVQAAQKLLKANAFRNPRCVAEGRQFEARCQGSALDPYRVSVDLTDQDRPQTACNCDSFKLPCKHALGLLLLAVRSPGLFGLSGAAARPGTRTVASPTPREAVADQPREAPKDVGEALFQAILEAPDDDTPRLIYADWLDEYGDPDRAEFIRGQVALAKQEAADARGKALAKRVKALWTAHRAEWLADLPEGLRARKNLAYHRGFFEELHLPLTIWQAHAAQLFARCPIVRLRLSGRLDRRKLAPLVVVPELKRLRELSLEGATFHEPLKTLQLLFDTPFFANIVRLNLAGCAFSSRELSVLLKSPLATHLRSLDLSGTAIGPTGVQSLLTTAALPALTEVVLYGVPLSTREQTALRDHFGARVLLD